MKDRLKEVIQRMVKGEKGLHTKIVGDFKLVRVQGIPKLLAANVKRDLDRKYYVFRKRINLKNCSILLLERNKT